MSVFSRLQSHYTRAVEQIKVELMVQKNLNRCVQSAYNSLKFFCIFGKFAPWYFIFPEFH